MVAALASTLVREPASGHDWLALTAEELPIGAAYEWVVRPDCGAVVLFSGTVRDHAEGCEWTEPVGQETCRGE